VIMVEHQFGEIDDVLPYQCFHVHGIQSASPRII
jgi:hypothetical protein